MKTTTKMKWNGSEVKIQGKKAINKSIYEIGLVVEGQAKELCPVDFGYLKASINTQSSQMGTDIELPSDYSSKTAELYFLDGKQVEGFRKITVPTKDSEVLVGSAISYGPYVEFGTVKMNSQPFLRPALDLARGKVLTLLWDGAKYYFGDYLLRGRK
ncbi:hypothetical protein M0R04_15865 [Candidatus Dojkabacteria bacterium]|nr:hypothetical protein [Candidatus Dojkabacteria bacterium]